MLKKFFTLFLFLFLSYFSFSEKYDLSINAGPSTQSYKVSYNCGNYSLKRESFSTEFSNYNFIFKNGSLGFFEDLGIDFINGLGLSFLAGPAYRMQAADFFSFSLGAGPFFQIQAYTKDDDVVSQDKTLVPKVDLEDPSSYSQMLLGGAIDIRFKFFTNRRCGLILGSKLALSGFIFDHREYDKESINLDHENKPVFFFQPYAGISFNFGK